MAKKVKSPTRVLTKKVRFGYVQVFKPASIAEGGDLKYSVCIIVKKTDTETLKRIKAGVDAAKKAGTTLWGGKIPGDLKKPLRDGDDERPDQEEFEGCYFMNANSNLRPGVLDLDKNEILDPSDFYSGCYGRASVNFFPYNSAGNKGIACGLNNLQKLTDGESLTGRTKPEDDFADDYEDEDDFLS